MVGSSNANDALEISIVQAGSTSPKTLSAFHPQFTYPIFGLEESVFGYQGLHISLRFAAHDARPNFEISYDRKFKPVADTKAADILATLKEWAPEGAFEKAAAFAAQLQNDPSAKDYKPPGKLLESYTSKGRNFEIWSGELVDPAVRQLVDRLQILISFFIEGGTPLELEDQEWTLARWRVYFVYEKLANLTNPSASPYSIVGYSTSYRFITYIPTTADKSLKSFSLPPNEPIHPTDLPSRVRISQFLILPSHHSHGHGTHLYNAMVSTFLASPTVTEITVEDPNEAFDDLRDYCDYNRLTNNGTLAQVKLNIDIDPRLSTKRIGVRVPTAKLLDQSLLEKLRNKNKIAPRQFYRLVEMHLLSQIDPNSRRSGTARITQRGRSSNLDDKAFFYWRMLVKQRVYKKNRDVLIQLDRLERAEKVEQTVGEVAGDYERVLKGMAKWGAGGAGRGGDAVSKAGRLERSKRKILEDEEDEDYEMEEAEPSAKRARSEAL